MPPEKCVRCNQAVLQEDKEFADNPETHPGVLGPVHKRCYNAQAESDPALPWTDPISGEIDFKGMEEDLGVATDDDFDPEMEDQVQV